MSGPRDEDAEERAEERAEKEAAARRHNGAQPPPPLPPAVMHDVAASSPRPVTPSHAAPPAAVLSLSFAVDYATLDSETLVRLITGAALELQAREGGRRR